MENIWFKREKSNLPILLMILPQAAGIVFVVEASEFLQNCSAASGYLYDILTKASVVKKNILVLILCNKTDKVTVHTKDFIRKQLEKELHIKAHNVIIILFGSGVRILDKSNQLEFAH